MAEANSKVDKGKIVNLIAVARERLSQAGEVLDEVEKLVAGGVGIGARLKVIEHCFEVNWAARYKADYIWNYTKDRAHLKRLLKKLSDGEIMRRMGTYLKEEDPFYVRARHGFNLFVGNVNGFADQPVAASPKAIPFEILRPNQTA